MNGHVATLWLAVMCSHAAAGNFTGLGTGPGYVSTRAMDISGDGRAVIGEGRFVTGGVQASWRWSAGPGMQALGMLPGYTGDSLPGGISQDGSVVTGYISTPGVGSVVGYRWIAGVIDQIEGGEVRTSVATSGDGLTAIGADGVPYSSFKSTAADGRVALGPLLGTPFGAGGFNQATACSYDGSLVAGWAYARTSISQPFSLPTPYRWTAAAGMQAVLNNGQLLLGSTSDMTSDGGTMVGGLEESALRIFRWTTATGYQFIDLLTPPASLPRVSADGLTIIAGLNYWSQTGGVQPIESVLTAAGCDFSGWTIAAATGISDNGLTLCGYGTNPQGLVEAWIATIPTPAPLFALGASLLLSATSRRRVQHSA